MYILNIYLCACAASQLIMCNICHTIDKSSHLCCEYIYDNGIIILELVRIIVYHFVSHIARNMMNNVA